MRTRELLTVKTSLAIAALLVSAGAQAAQTWNQPLAQLRVEANSNRLLNPPALRHNSTGYALDLGTTWGIATPASQTLIKPQLSYVNFSRDNESSVQGQLEVASYYNSPRSQFNIYGQYDQRATAYSELASAQFNILLPNNPTAPETGNVRVDTTRKLATVNGGYNYATTQRSSVGITATLQRTNYTGANANLFTNYSYALANAYVGWATSQRTELRVGVLASKNDNRSAGDATTKGAGGNIQYNINWRKNFQSKLEVSYQRHDFTETSPIVLRTNASSFGGTYYTTWTGQLSQVQLDVGRTFTPSGYGGLSQADHVQFEYLRKLSERKTVDLATRYIRYTALTTAGSAADYRYLTSDLGMKWLVTRTWFVSAGLEYYRVERPNAAQTANNGMIYLSAGYQGLGRRQ